MGFCFFLGGRRRLSDELEQLALGGLGQQLAEVGIETLVGLLRCALALACVLAIELLWRGEQ